MILSTGTANAGITDSVSGGTIEFGTAAARIVTATDLTIGSASNPVALQQTNATFTNAVLVKTGSGTLTLYGVQPVGTSTTGTTIGTTLNTAGTTRSASIVYVGEGKLVLGNQYALGTTFATTVSGTPNGVMPTLAINAGATVDINNQTLTFAGVTGAGTLALGSGTAYTVTGSGLNFSGQLTGTAASTFAIGYPQSAGTTYGTGNNSILMGDNSGFFGAFKVLQTNLQFRSANSLVNNNPIQLGDTLSPNSGSKATTLVFYDTGTSYTTDITVPAMATQGTGTVGTTLIIGNEAAGGFMTLNGSITLGRNTNIGASNGGSRSGMFTVASKITGPGQLIVNPFASFAFSGGNIAFTNPTNDYAGGTVLNEANGVGSATTGVNCIVAVGADTVFSNGPITLDNQPGVLRADGGARNLNNAINVNPSTSATTRPVAFGFVGTNDFTLSGPISSTLANPAAAQVVNLIVDDYSLGNSTFAGQISNGTAANISLGLTKNGPGTLNLTGTGNSYTGPVVFNAGTLGIGANNALGTGALTLNGGTFKTVGGSWSIGNTISGAGGLILEGTNTLTVNGASTAAGTNLVSSGTLKIGNATTLGLPVVVAVSSVGVAANTTVVNGAALDLNGQQTVNEPIVINGTGVGGTGALINSAAGTVSRIGSAVSSLTVNTFGSGTVTAPLSINISGAGSGATATASLGLTQAGIGLLTGGNYASNPSVSITGGGGTGATATAVRSGSVVIGINLTNAGSGYTSPPTITFSGGGTGATQATAAFNNGFFQLLNVTLTTVGSGYTSGATAGLSTGDASITANASSVTLASNAAAGGDGDIIIDGQVRGPGGLTKVGFGTVTLNAANTYAGGTTISTGNLAVVNDAALGVRAAHVRLDRHANLHDDDHDHPVVPVERRDAGGRGGADGHAERQFGFRRIRGRPGHVRDRRGRGRPVRQRDDHPGGRRRCEQRWRPVLPRHQRWLADHRPRRQLDRGRHDGQPRRFHDPGQRLGHGRGRRPDQRVEFPVVRPDDAGPGRVGRPGDPRYERRHVAAGLQRRQPDVYRYAGHGWAEPGPVGPARPQRDRRRRPVRQQRLRRRHARRLAAALTKLGLQSGDRVASMMWNHSGHLEAFFGVPCAGGILHTLNLRLHPHEIAAIAKHARRSIPDH